jgi:3-deoxy-D-manno-octulosonate 8-phosphate phosphatase (KDO 8-P phosphatase)
MEKNMDKAVEAAKKLKLLILDVHGVMTDNRVYYSDTGARTRAFAHPDGFGTIILGLMGVEVALITRKSKIVAQRVADLKIKRYYETREKVKKYEELKEELNLTDEQCGYVGDEVIDLGVMEKCGFPVAPSNADAIAKEVSLMVTDAAGGEGVVRELAEFILRAQGKWDKVIEMVKKKGF